MFDPSLLPPESRKLYVLVREDLAPGLRAAQAGHAIANLCLCFPEVGWKWNMTDNYLIVLGVADEEALWNWWDHLEPQITCRAFFLEPDLGGSITAAAFFPQPPQNHLFSMLPLAYSRKPTPMERFNRWIGRTAS